MVWILAPLSTANFKALPLYPTVSQGRPCGQVRSLLPACCRKEPCQLLWQAELLGEGRPRALGWGKPYPNSSGSYVPMFSHNVETGEFSVR